MNNWDIENTFYQIASEVCKPAIGYSPAHVVYKDVIVTQDFDLISFALRDYRIKTTLPLALTLTSPYLLNSHIVMIDSLQKQSKQKTTNTYR